MRVFLVMLFALSALSVSGCKSDEDKFCDHMRELYGDKMDDCEKDALPEVKAKCENADEVFKCAVGASDKKAADKCYKETCKKKKK